MNCKLCNKAVALASCKRCHIPVCTKECMTKNWKDHKNECGHRMWKLKYKNATKEKETTCPICMDEMEGNVMLKCGHQMCPCCFAQHARVNNTCPFCRDIFAPKIKEMPMPQLIVDDVIPMPQLIVDDVIATEIEDNMRDRILDEIGGDITIASNILSSCEESMQLIARSVMYWYE